jgi:hypothetical protein
MNIASLMVAVAVAVAAAACGGSAPATGTGETAAPAAATSSRTADTCALLTAAAIQAAVGNAVLDGKPSAGPEVCHWDTDRPEDVSVLLTVRLKDSDRERVLCEAVRRGAAGTTGITGVGDAATWTFSRVGTMFNSGDLEACSVRGFVGLSLNGAKDEAALRRAAETLAAAVLGRL